MLVLLATVSAISFAQSDIPVYVRCGFGMSSYYGPDAGGSKPLCAIKLGVGTEIPLNDNFSIQPTLYFDEKGARYTIPLNNSSYRARVHEYYVELPVLATYRVELTKTSNIAFGLGPYAAYGVGGKAKYSIDTGVGSISSEEINTFSSNGWNLRRFDAGIAVGVTGEFDDFIIGVDSQFGLTKLEKNGDNYHNVTVFLNISYRI